MLAFAVFRELIPRRRCGIARPWAFIANIGPHPRGGCLAFTLCLQLDRGVIGEQGCPGLDALADSVGERFQQDGALPDPASEGGAGQIDIFAPINLALAIQRQVVGVFADHDMCE